MGEAGGGGGGGADGLGTVVGEVRGVMLRRRAVSLGETSERGAFLPYQRGVLSRRFLRCKYRRMVGRPSPRWPEGAGHPENVSQDLDVSL